MIDRGRINEASLISSAIFQSVTVFSFGPEIITHMSGRISALDLSAQGLILDQFLTNRAK